MQSPCATPNIIDLLTDAISMCHAIEASCSRAQHPPEELTKLTDLLPTYERSATSLLDFVRTNEARMADDHSLTGLIKNHAIQAVALILDCRRRVHDLVAPEWWLQTKAASQAKHKLVTLVAEVERWSTSVEQGISGGSFEHPVAQQSDQSDPRTDGLIIHNNRIFTPDRAVGRPASFNVPSQYLLFAGRNSMLINMHAHLSLDQTSEECIQPLGISGRGSVGKTELAIEYVYRYWFDDHPVFWIRADSVANMAIDFLALANHLGLPARGVSKIDDAIDGVKRWLSTNKDWLLVFDNAEDLGAAERFFPPANHQGRILLTTRHHRSDTIRLMPLDITDISEGHEILSRRAGIDMTIQTESALRVGDELVQMLRGEPLALTQAGAYIKQEKCDIREYITLYQGMFASATAKWDPEREDAQSVSVSLALTLDRICDDHAFAMEVLHICAFLHPDAIPIALVHHLIRSGDSTGSHTDVALAISEAVQVLVDFSLLSHRRSVVDGDHVVEVLSMHRFVQAIVRSTMDGPSERLRAEVVVSGVVGYIDGLSPPQRQEEVRTLLPQMQACVRHVESHQMHTDSALRLVRMYSQQLLDCQSLDDAHKAISLGLAMSSEEHGPSHVEYARCVELKASLHHCRNEHGEASLEYQRALAIREESQGSDHPDIVPVLNKLAEVYRDQGKYDRCRVAVSTCIGHPGEGTAIRSS